MKTVFYDEHVALGAKIVDFAGWQMPLYYSLGALKEHLWVREHAGLFDISHMAKIWVEGEESEKYLNFLATNNIHKIVDGQAQYNVLCNPLGGAVDDVIVYRCSHKRYFVAVNASNRGKDLEHFKKYAPDFKVTIREDFEGYGILALQGPQSKMILSKDFPEIAMLKFMHFIELKSDRDPLIIARTGYTGELGYELYGNEKNLKTLWGKLLEENLEQLKPIGLAARDSLRLEMGYALYGHELSDEILPIETVAAWAVKLNKEHFLGKEALAKKSQANDKRSQYAVRLAENAIARPGATVVVNNQTCGLVTSGGFSPTLKSSIAIIMVDKILHQGDFVDILIRDRKVGAQVVKLPFIEHI